MFKSLFIIIALSGVVFAFTITNGQSIIKIRTDRQRANEMLKSLNKKIADTTRIGILLQLAEFNLEKDGYEKKDMDSAATFIRNAKELNAKQILRKSDGLISLYEADLLRKNGDTTLARQLANQSIKQLQTSNDELHLIQAYLELSRCYNSNVPKQATVIKNVFYTLFQRIQKLVSDNQLVTQEQMNQYMLELISFYHLKMSALNLVVRLNFLDHIIRAYRTMNDKVNEFWARKEIADIHFKQCKLQIAINELLEIAKEQKAGDYPRICFTYDLLSGLYYADSKLDKALYYSLETIKNVRTAADSPYLSNFYSRIAFYYEQTGSQTEALNWNLKRLDYLIAAKRTLGIYVIIDGITASMIKSGRSKEALDLVLDKSKSFVPYGNWEKRSMLLSLARCYEAVKNIAMAEKYCEELIKFIELRIKQKEWDGDPDAINFLASFYLNAGQLGNAEKYFNLARPEGSKRATKPTSIFETSFLFRLDSAKGNYVSAIEHLQAFHRASDSLFTAAKAKQIEELKIVYATEQKDSLINLKEENIQLLTKEDQLQKSKLQQGAILRNISFAVVSLLIIIMLLLFNRYRLKQKTNRKLELQQHEIEKQNLSLHHLVNEKEWLVKEIHHRVKNNLQIVMSLLNSQSAYIENDAALTAIHDSQHRVHAMSLIHQKLYSTENVSSIDMSVYIRELTFYLADSFDMGKRIRFEYDIAPLELDVSQAVPLGLILNEAITNSIKYAFPNGRNGVIAVSLSPTIPSHYLLTISDNGIGMVPDFNNKKTGSLGMSLMAGLSEDLDGSFSIENNKGTTVKISFVHDLRVKQHDKITSSFVSNN